MVKSKPSTDRVSTGVTVPREVMEILRRAALHRAEIDGTRLSVSGVVVDLVLANREILERGA